MSSTWLENAEIFKKEQEQIVLQVKKTAAAVCGAIADRPNGKAGVIHDDTLTLTTTTLDSLTFTISSVDLLGPRETAQALHRLKIR